MDESSKVGNQDTPMPQEVNKDINLSEAQPIKKSGSPFIFLTLLLIIVGFSIYLASYLNLFDKLNLGIVSPKSSPASGTTVVLSKFASQDEFIKYMENGRNVMNSYIGGGIESGVPITGDIVLKQGGEMAAVQDRASTTNVQVTGIDEPDIVKVGKNNIYFSSLGLTPQPLLDTQNDSVSKSLPSGARGSYPGGKINVVAAYPVESIAISSEIENSGNLLVYKDTLVVFEAGGENIVGYDVTDPANPSKKWDYGLDSRNRIVSSRLYNGKIFVAVQNYSPTGCTFPLTTGTNGLNIICTEIFRPPFQIPSDSLFTVFSLDMETGTLLNRVSFVGTSGLSILYMSPDAIYMTYTYTEDIVKFYVNFYEQKASDLVSKDILDRMKKILTLDISDQSKFNEFSIILRDYQSSLTEDELLKVENETQNRLSDYTKENIRKFDKTAITKISTKDLSILATGVIPGSPLNQFSLDEYKGKLRAAVTLGNTFVSNSDSVNDVYVLDENMNEIGSVLDLGKGEKIYSARFIGDLGYIVTFKQTDPFYVLDLSKPSSPKLSGELKIPGYSSYLHPLSDNLILGIGKEDQSVKLSLFDVSNPDNPQEIDKYTLSEYWSEAINNHHAFLQDKDNSIFFIPGQKGGYVFSYRGQKLSLQKAISATAIDRALYIDNYMYFVSQNGISVYDMESWNKLKDLSF